MKTLHILAGGILLLALFATRSISAQTASTADYDFLLSISEPARFDLYDRTVPKDDRNIVPIATAIHAEIDLSHPLPALDVEGKDPSHLSITELIQLATAFRLRGDYVAAVPHYARIVHLSKQPIHAFFYAQALRATGQDLLADLYSARYSQGIGGTLEEQVLNDAQRSGVPAFIRGQVVDIEFRNAIPNVEVRLVNICTEEEFVTSTDSEGNFEFRDHPADCPFVVRFKKRFFEVVLVEATTPKGDERVDVELNAVQELSPVRGTRILASQRDFR